MPGKSVIRHSAHDDTECHFKRYPTPYRQPVQLPQEINRVVISQTCIRQDARESILLSLKLVEVLFRRAVEQRVTVVDPCTDDAASDRVSHFSREVTCDMAQLSYMKVT